MKDQHDSEFYDVDLKLENDDVIQNPVMTYRMPNLTHRETNSMIIPPSMKTSRITEKLKKG